jgi:hypothetical protein
MTRLIVGLIWACCMSASAYTVNLTAGTRAIYLRIGDGVMMGGHYSMGGAPRTGGAVNLVSIDVPASSLGNRIEQSMQGTGRGTSDWDGYAFCNSGQTYIGGFFRIASTSVQNATLRVTGPTHLINAHGHGISMSDISWNSGGNNDTNTQPITEGRFVGGTQTLATNFLRNTWRESCLSFRYRNHSIPAAGIYRARVTYTLATP